MDASLFLKKFTLMTLTKMNNGGYFETTYFSVNVAVFAVRCRV